jgi:hypothetical protein
VDDTCWCGGQTPHSKHYWHDPTHGRVDRDIQDRVTEVYGNDFPVGQRVAIENTLQNYRDRGDDRT